MITFTPQQAIFYLILGPIALIVILMALSTLVRIANTIISLKARNKAFKQKQQELATFKKNGNFHEWVLIPVNDTETGYVCRKTGYYPTLEGFFPSTYIEKHLKEQVEKIAYAKFKSERMSEIAVAFGLKLDEMDALTQEFIAIPQQYAVGKLQFLQDELKTTANNLENSLNEKKS